ncbi:MAG: lysophospholipid acyltransferase family protein [Gammaproteobacteria bacterium]|jgi:putative hemolysin|nr:lysophospholipid acyltransferase family protein [Gammaproteobacteria bacterium]
MTNKKARPFKLNGQLALTKIPKLNLAIESGLEKITGLHRLDQMYLQLPPADNDIHFLKNTLELFNVNWHVLDNELSNIPAQGPAIIVANHPFGALEGVLMAYILRQYRSDVKIMANYFLQRIPEISDVFIGVDPFGGKKSTNNNLKPMREAIQWLKQGGLLLIFPAGEVSHRKWLQKEIADPPWSNTVARLIKITQATVTPVYIHGQNSNLFQWAGLIHPRLRTVMLFRELLNKQKSSIIVRIGKTISYPKLKSFDNESELLHYLRIRTYMLKDAELAKNLEKQYPDKPLSATERLEPICEAPSNSLIKAEIAALPATQLLTEGGNMQVFYATAKQIPWVLQEIGRLREITFRETGEGTGKSIDLDLYDEYYHHLFVWNKTRLEVIGAYRLGLADKIVEQFGIKGLYTRTLFKYKRQLLESLYPSIELGRSFVRQEYQRNFVPIMLLWKGIGQFIAQNPRYRYLFGPVSISSEYETVSQQLLVDFLKNNNFHQRLARHVKPLNPFRKAIKSSWKNNDFAVVNDIEQISDIVAQFEKDHKGVPILLKQYLKLGGTLLGFNVDHDFNNALDGLIMVDLVKTDTKVLSKYLGTEQTEAFLAFHEDSMNKAS